MEQMITIDHIQLDENTGRPRYNKMHNYTGIRTILKGTNI